MKVQSVIWIVMTVLGVAGCAADAVGPAGLRPVAAVPLPGVEGRFDHFAVDAKGQRLFVAALGNNTVEVIDLAKHRKLAQLTGMKKPTGVAFVSASRRLIVASGDDGKCRVYDDALKLVGQLADLDDADNVRYDAKTNRLYVGYGEGAITVIDPDKIARLGDVPLKAHPESFRLESAGKRIFANVTDAGHIAVIDRQRNAVVATWPLTAARANFPMFMDEAHHRLFVGCRRPAKLLVIDTDTGHLVTSVDCCGDTDDLFYDAARRRVYVSGGEGCIDVFDQVDADHYVLHGRVRTAPGARTCYFSTDTDRLYLAVPHRGNQQAEIRVYEPQR